LAESDAISGGTIALIGSIGESRDAKKINALIVNAIGTKIATRRIRNETKKLPSLEIKDQEQKVAILTKDTLMPWSVSPLLI
jgi:hypothetical protein